MNIAEVEKTTGITKQNIRFYEKEGLIQPKRNPVNGYREYGPEEIRNLKMVRILRKTGMSIEEIAKVLSGEEPFYNAVSVRRQNVEKEREELKAVIDLCEELKSQSLDYIDVDYYLSWIRKEEEKGNMLYRLWEDYKQVAKSEAKKKFFFLTDDIINTPQEFTDALLKYARIQGADITITKESMYPEFIWNGVEYSAMRIEARYCSKVQCEMKYPEQADPGGMEEGRKKKLTIVNRLIPFMIWEFFIFLFTFYGFGEEELTATFLSMAIFAVIYLARHFIVDSNML